MKWLPRFERTPRRRRLERTKTICRLEQLERRTVLSGVFPVLNEQDSGFGSLRQAIQDANDAPGLDTIVFANPVHRITLTSGELAITDDLRVAGPGAQRLVVSGNQTSRVFNIALDTRVEISGLTIANGVADGNASTIPSSGGGILNLGNLSLIHVVLADNLAIGDANAVVDAGPAFQAAGGAFGGGIANFNELEILGGTFSNNAAIAADNVTTPDMSFPFGPAFPGASFGGAISNYATAIGPSVATTTISQSQFAGNLARGGSFGYGEFASNVGGGAIANASVLSVSDSAFQRNLAVAGDNNVSPQHNGHSLGGAIYSGSLTPFVVPTDPGASVAVTNSQFVANEAIGGNGNVVTLPIELISRADGPNNAYGGAILALQGSGSIQGSSFFQNRAISGRDGATQNGGLGVGGGVFFFDFVGGVTGSIHDSVFRQNEAIGSTGEVGGDGLGGGLAVGSLGAPFGLPGDVTVTGASFEQNRAIGGDGLIGPGGSGQGGAVAAVEGAVVRIHRGQFLRNRAIGGIGTVGGNGQGGGLFNHGTATTSLAWSQVLGNRARGGRSALPITEGLGQGGGIFNAAGGLFQIDPFSRNWTRRNRASTSANNVFGSLSPL